MVGPTGDASEPGLKQLELAVAQFGSSFLKQEDAEYFLFQHSSGEQLVGNLNQKIQALLANDGSPKPDRYFAQFGGVPTTRLDLLFEEPLHTLGVGSGAAVFENAADVGRDVGGSDFSLRHLRLQNRR